MLPYAAGAGVSACRRLPVFAQGQSQPVGQHKAAAQADGDGRGREHAPVAEARVDNHAADKRGQQAACVKGGHHDVGVEGARGGG